MGQGINSSSSRLAGPAEHAIVQKADEAAQGWQTKGRYRRFGRDRAHARNAEQAAAAVEAVFDPLAHRFRFVSDGFDQFVLLGGMGAIRDQTRAGAKGR